MIDLDQGWCTERLALEPLVAEHAAELGPLLDDVALHKFTGGKPLSAAALAARYARRTVSNANHRLRGDRWLVAVKHNALNR